MTTSCSIEGFKVIEAKCTGCERCIQYCPADAIEMVNKKAIITSKCTNCGACSTECPEHAIETICADNILNQQSEVRLDSLS